MNVVFVLVVIYAVVLGRYFKSRVSVDDFAFLNLIKMLEVDCVAGFSAIGIEDVLEAVAPFYFTGDIPKF